MYTNTIYIALTISYHGSEFILIPIDFCKFLNSERESMNLSNNVNMERITLMKWDSIGYW